MIRKHDSDHGKCPNVSQAETRFLRETGFLSASWIMAASAPRRTAARQKPGFFEKPGFFRRRGSWQRLHLDGQQPGRNPLSWRNRVSLGVVDHGSVCTSTDSTDGRSRTMGAQLSPASAEAYTWPPVVPK